MPENNTTVNIAGTDYISNINPIYYGTVGGVVEKLIDKSAGELIAKTTLPGGTVIASIINLIKDPENPGKVIVSTVAASGITYFATATYGSVAVAATEVIVGSALATLGIIASPLIISVTAVGIVAVGTTMIGNELQSVIYDSLSTYENFDFYSPEIVGTVTKDEFIAQSASNDPDFCKNIFPEYVNYRQITEIKSGSESYLYNQLTKEATVNSTNEKDATEVILKNTQADKLTLNNQPLDIASPTALQLRNALESISDYQFLLSDVLIKPDEMLDMGDAGVVTVSSGDTLSQLAVKYLGGNAVDATREAVLLNPWLADEGRINFIAGTDKILLNAGASLADTNQDHVYKNQESADFFYDANGGFDTYLTGKDDIVQDSDSKGLVNFKNKDLTGTKLLKEGSTDTYEDDEGFEYKRDGDTLVVTDTKSGESISILEWSDEKNLGIKLRESDDIDINIGDASEVEAAQEMQVTVEILRELDVDEILEVEVGYYIPTYIKEYYGPEIFVPAQAASRTYDDYSQVWKYSPARDAYSYRNHRSITTGEEFVGVGSVTFTKEDRQTQEFAYNWNDEKLVGVKGNGRKSAYNETTQTYNYNSPASLTLTAKHNQDGSSISEDVKITTKQTGTATIINDDEQSRVDPLVLDLNKEGFISTTSLDDSNTYFDITGEKVNYEVREATLGYGLRERVGWVKGEDGLQSGTGNNTFYFRRVDGMINNLKKAIWWKVA